MQYLVLSFSHKNTDISLREKLAFDEKQKKILLDSLAESCKEIILLSTCNRVEILMMTNDTYSIIQKCLLELSNLSNIPKDELEGRANTFEGYSAIHHIFLVASSLDSLVVGETQIGGQLREAYKFAINNSYCTTTGLGDVIDFAFKCASNIRNNTGISQKPISIASVAVSTISNLEINNKTAIVVGLGEMGQIAAKHLLSNGYKVILINRNRDKAIAFANELDDAQIKIEDFSNLANVINQYELLFSATAAPNAIITNDMIKPTNFKRYFFDLAMPRDIEDMLDSSISLNLIDDLQKIVKSNIASRNDSLNTAYEIVGNSVNDFFKRLNILRVEPIIKTLRNLAKEASIKEIDKAISKGYLPESSRENLLKTIHNVFNIFLHTPTKKIKEMSSSKQIYDIERTLKLLFNINDDAISKAKEEHDKDARNINYKGRK